MYPPNTMSTRAYVFSIYLFISLLPTNIAVRTFEVASNPNVYLGFRSVGIFWSDVALLITVVMGIMNRRYYLQLNRVVIGLVVLSIIVLRSARFAEYPQLAIFLTVRLALLVMFATLIDEDTMHHIINAIIFSAICNSILALIQFDQRQVLGLNLLGELPLQVGVPGVAVFASDNILFLRPIGFTAHPTILGAWLLLGCGLVFARAMMRPFVWIDFGLGGIILFALLLTHSRGAWIGIAIMMLSLLIAYKVIMRASLQQLMDYSMIVGIIGIGFLLLQMPQILARFGGGQGVQSTSLSDRTLLIRAALDLWRPLGQPLGAYNFSLASDNAITITSNYSHDFMWQPVHNVSLLIASEVGLLGIVVWWLLFLNMFVISAINLIRRQFGLYQVVFLSLSIYFCAVDGLINHFQWTSSVGLVMVVLCLIAPYSIPVISLFPANRP